VQTLNESSGKPYLKYSGALAQFMQERGWSAQVTITDEIEMVSAVVIVTKDA
jgi:holo-[acyl-carrier protein] synthase